MKNFRTDTFVIWSITFGVLSIISFIAAFAEDEGTSNIFATTLAKLFYILRFPTHKLFSGFVSNSWGLILADFVLNSLLYGFVAERLTYFYKKQEKSKN